MDYFIWLEETGFSIWMRESGPAFFSSLVLHSLSMAMVVGVNVAIAFRILGVAGRVPVSAMARFTPVAYWGLGVVLISGGLLLIAYPTKALTNPVFYFRTAQLSPPFCLAISQPAPRIVTVHGIL